MALSNPSQCKPARVERARRWLDEHRGWLVALGALGMLGFVGACVASMLGVVSVVTQLELCAAALAAYALGIGAGHAGNGHGTEHRRPRLRS